MVITQLLLNIIINNWDLTILKTQFPLQRPSNYFDAVRVIFAVNRKKHMKQVIRPWVKMQSQFLLLLRARQLKLRKHLSLVAYCATLNFHQHRFSIPVSLIKRQRSLSEAVLISFGSKNGFPKML